MRNCERLSVSLHREVIRRVEETGRVENRNRSNVIETILRQHYRMTPREQQDTRQR